MDAYLNLLCSMQGFPLQLCSPPRERSARSPPVYRQESEQAAYAAKPLTEMASQPDQSMSTHQEVQRVVEAMLREDEKFKQNKLLGEQQPLTGVLLPLVAWRGVVSVA